MSVRVLAGGLHFGEGPRWHQGKLWFSDFYDHAVRTLDMDGVVETKYSTVDQPSGLGWLPDGRILIVSMQDRTVLRSEYGHLVVHADLSSIATFHCNDMVVDASGRAYVGNFGFDLDAAIASGTLGEVLAAHDGAALAIVEPDGSARIGATGMIFPNGSVITPDGRTLIVAESLGRRLTAFDVAADGSLDNRRVWADLGHRTPDGICLDADGAVWVANATAPECVRVAPGGQVLHVVDTGDPCYACMLGGPDGRTLFMLTAAAAQPSIVATERTGRILVTEVDAAHAGLP